MLGAEFLDDGIPAHDPHAEVGGAPIATGKFGVHVSFWNAYLMFLKVEKLKRNLGSAGGGDWAILPESAA